MKEVGEERLRGAHWNFATTAKDLLVANRAVVYMAERYITIYSYAMRYDFFMPQVLLATTAFVQFNTAHYFK